MVTAHLSFKYHAQSRGLHLSGLPEGRVIGHIFLSKKTTFNDKTLSFNIRSYVKNYSHLIIYQSLLLLG